ncbi:MAG: DUF4115 domain-containing protein [Geobacteraceae bacterium]|nr:DUF4115 domain-containing protein [Geobacteraceae bacterium]
MYDKQQGAKNDDTDTDAKMPGKVRPARRMASLQKLMLPTFLLLLILIIAIFFKSPPPDPLKSTQPIVSATPATTNIPVQPILSSARVESVSPKVAEPRTEKMPEKAIADEKPTVPNQPAVDNAKGFILKITVTQTGSMTVTVDGSTPQDYELTVGDIIEWKAEKTIALDVSNAGGIELELNGKPYRQLGPSGKPVYVELNSEGIKP